MGIRKFQLENYLIRHMINKIDKNKDKEKEIEPIKGSL